MRHDVGFEAEFDWEVITMNRLIKKYVLLVCCLGLIAPLRAEDIDLFTYELNWFEISLWSHFQIFVNPICMKVSSGT